MFESNLYNFSPSSGVQVVDDGKKRAEMKLAVYIAMHASIKSMDHLGELLRDLGSGSVLADVRCHRTKCSRLIDSVVAPTQREELLADIGDSSYTLIVDEVTDISVSKFMGVCIRYYSKEQRAMVTDFLGIIQVTGCTGKELATALLDYLRSIGLNPMKMRAIGVDGAPNMCGVNNSFFTHLRDVIPHLSLFKCVCHSIDKCAEHAFNCMPDSVSELLNGTTNWFGHSSKRWDEYVQFYKVRNPIRRYAHRGDWIHLSCFPLFSFSGQARWKETPPVGLFV